MGTPRKAKQLLTSEDVAKRLNVGVSTVYGLFTSGEIKADKIGGKWRTRDENVEEYLDKILS